MSNYYYNNFNNLGEGLFDSFIPDEQIGVNTVENDGTSRLDIEAKANTSGANRHTTEYDPSSSGDDNAISNPWKYIFLVGLFIFGGFIAKMAKKR